MMSISPSEIYAPQPSTARAQTSPISYDAKNDRIAYAMGKSIVVRSLDPQKGQLTRQFTKHTYPTTVATFSPSGNYVASGDESGQVKVWDCTIFPGREEATFEEPYVKNEIQVIAGPIRSICWDSDNARIFAVGEGRDKFGHCFTWDTGNSVGEIQGHSDTIRAVTVKPQRPYRAATVGDDKALVFYTGPPFKFNRSVRDCHTNFINDVKFSPDGNLLVSVGSDRVIGFYEGKTGGFLKKIEGAHEGGIYGVCWNSDSSKFYTCSADNTVKSWDASTSNCLSTFMVSKERTVENQQVGIAISKDHIVSLSYNGNLNYFKEDAELPFFILSGHQKPLTSISVKDNALITGSSDGQIFTRSVSSPEEATLKTVARRLGDSYTLHSNYVSGILQLEDKVVTAGWDDTLKIWENERLKNTVQLGSQPRQLLACNDNTFFVLCESSLELWGIAPDLSKRASVELEFEASSIANIKDKKILLVANVENNTIQEFSYSENTIQPLLHSYPPSRMPSALIRVSPSDEYAAVGDTAGKYTLFKTSDRSPVTTRWAFHNARVVDAKWSPDSKFYVSGGLDSSVYVYSVEKPSKVLKLTLVHQNGVTGLEWLHYHFNDDKKAATIATIGNDGFIKTWKVDLSVY